MPYKPPDEPLQVETLSDHKADHGRCDFTRERIKSEPRAIATARDARKARAEAERKANRMILNLMPSTAEPRLVAPTKPGMRVITTIAGCAVYVSKKPWRRI